MYYEIHGSGEPVVLLHGAFMAITGRLERVDQRTLQTRKVIAVEMQGHGRTADHQTRQYLRKPRRRCGSAARLSQDRTRGLSSVTAWAAASRCSVRSAIRKKVRKVVSISARLRRDGWVKEANDFWPTLHVGIFKGTPMEAEYKKLSPTRQFPDFVNHHQATALRPYDFGAEKLKATKAPMFFIHGDADGVRLDHIAEMFRLKGGGEIHGDMQPRPASRLAILPDTTHVTLMNRMTTIVPMINDFLDAKVSKQ
jgi:pimeloyl-ACP methyl ester carboxylesterase